MKDLSDKATDQEVLQAAIQKTINNGWERGKDYLGVEYNEEYGSIGASFETTGHVNEIIFNHGFCKALWGGLPWHGPRIEERPLGKAISAGNQLSAWQYHGTQMFLAEDRIDYLRRHL